MCSEIHELSAVELRECLAAGRLGAREVVNHYLDRIAALNPELGAFVHVSAEAAVEEATAADALYASPGMSREMLPPLHGVPVAFKDLTDVRGAPTTHGSAALTHSVAPADGALASALRAAGAISLGKTQVPEFGLTGYSENRVAAPARNPYDLTTSPGGSSGGSAAAVAAGLLPFAPGTDGGGSIRIPAAATGLVGLKPNRGRVPSGSGQSDAGGLVVAGPLARSAADAGLLLDVLASEPNYHATSAAPGGSFLDAAGSDPGPLRIGISLDTPWASEYPIEVEPAARNALDAAAALLAAAGHRLLEAPVRYDNRYPEAFTTVWTSGVGAARIPPAREQFLTPLTHTFRRRAQQKSAVKLAEALAFLRQFEHDTIAQFADFDVILTPALAQQPRPVGWYTGEDWEADPDEDYKRQCQYAPWSSPVNVTGLPALTLPVHWTPSGVPMGVQLIGRPSAEATLLALAGQLERHAGFRPPFFGWTGTTRV